MGKLMGRIWRILAWLAPIYQFRAAMHRRCGVKIGKGVFIGANVMIDSEYPEYVEIGDWAAIGPGAMIMTHSGASQYHQKLGIYHQAPKRVVIERGAWVASGAIILPGVTVGEGSIVAAGAVVGKDVAPMTMVMGNPARAIQRLERKKS